MNKTQLLLILFLGLGLGAYYLINKDKSTSSVDLTYDTDFTVDDIDDVHKIFLADRKGNATTLTKKAANHWVLADGSKVRKYPIEFILKCLQKLEYKYLLSEPEGEFAIERIAVSGIKVEVYDKADKNLLTFYVGPNANDHEGSYMMKEGSDKPQIMNLPGHVGEMRTIFEMTGDEWKDRTVFAVNKSDIKSVAIEYPKQKSKSFKLINEGETKIVPLDQYTPAKNQKPNASIVEVFLEEFESKVAENFKNQVKGDSVLQVVPFANLTIERKDGGVEEFRFIPMINKNTGSDGTPLPGKSAMMRYYTTKKGGDIYSTQHHVMKDIFRSYDSFFQ